MSSRFSGDVELLETTILDSGATKWFKLDQEQYITNLRKFLCWVRPLDIGQFCQKTCREPIDIGFHNLLKCSMWNQNLKTKT